MDPVVLIAVGLWWVLMGRMVTWRLSPPPPRGLASAPSPTLLRRIVRITFWPVWAAYTLWRTR